MFLSSQPYNMCFHMCISIYVVFYMFVALNVITFLFAIFVPIIQYYDATSNIVALRTQTLNPFACHNVAFAPLLMHKTAIYPLNEYNVGTSGGGLQYGSLIIAWRLKAKSQNFFMRLNNFNKHPKYHDNIFSHSKQTKKKLSACFKRIIGQTDRISHITEQSNLKTQKLLPKLT